jgi:hypothetical protein
MTVWLFRKVADPEAIVLTGGTSFVPVIFDATKTSCAKAFCVAVFKKLGLVAVAAYNNNVKEMVARKVICCTPLTII